MSDDFDVIVLGAGSGGENLAGQLASQGWRVAAVEEHRVGGECPFTACMPSKAMLHDGLSGVPFEEAVLRRDEVAEHFDDHDHAEGLTSRGVELVRGRGVLAGRGEVGVDGRTLHATHVVVATGAGPTPMPLPGAAEVGAWDSDAAWTTHELPQSLIVVGAGAVGTEIATGFRAFGAEVALINRSPAVLSDEAQGVASAVADALAAAGIRLHLGTEVASIGPDPVGVRVMLSDGTDLTAARLVIAIGKTPRLDIGLDTIGLSREGWSVERSGRVRGAESLWAVGDVTGFPAYTHVANAMADVIAENLGRELRGEQGEDRELHVEHLPRCVFTDPPLAAVGTVDADDDEVVVVEATYGDIARPLTDRTRPGTAQLAVQRADRRVRGFVGVGHAMDELVGQFALAIRVGATADDLAATVQPFPTHSEIVKLLGSRAVDALNVVLE